MKIINTVHILIEFPETETQIILNWHHTFPTPAQQADMIL